jgi:hypothetical protein
MSISRSVDNTIIGRHGYMIAGKITGIIRFTFLEGMLFSLDEMDRRRNKTINEVSLRVCKWLK